MIIMTYVFYVCERNDFEDDDIKLKVCACDKPSLPTKIEE